MVRQREKLNSAKEVKSHKETESLNQPGSGALSKMWTLRHLNSIESRLRVTNSSLYPSPSSHTRFTFIPSVQFWLLIIQFVSFVFII